MATLGRLGERVAQLQQQSHLRPCCSSSVLILEASVALTRRASDTACVPSAKSFSRMIMSLVPCEKRWQDRDMLMAVSSLSPVRTHTCAMRCLGENRSMTETETAYTMCYMGSFQHTSCMPVRSYREHEVHTHKKRQCTKTLPALAMYTFASSQDK